ncbi:uncharacterized protein K441DRAFT_667935 [Cenococcum geophilum 1.58]|uniref:uncharacterized protein n=1 Tax=Cenococcum geophilum 1.58 TaxID=794803 RepID=UPI00358E5C3D|nr:hypothetical protein K441DRAFT_667935 [Cenococcum geophilum 1.58]
MEGSARGPAAKLLHEALREALPFLCVCARHITIGPRYIPDSLYTCLCQVYPLYTPR